MTERTGSPAIEPPSGLATPSSGASRRGWYTVFMLALVSMLAQLDRGVIALFVEPIKRDLGLSDTQVSLLVGFAFTFPYVLVGLPMSRFIDRGVRRSLVAGSLAIWSGATAVCGMAQNFWTLFFSRAVIGGSESVNTPASYSIIADAIPRERLPRAYAILNAGVTGGTALSLLIGGVLIGLFANMQPIALPGIGVIRNWQLVFIFVGIPGLLVAALIMTTVPEPPRKDGRKPGGFKIGEVVGFLKAHSAMHLPLLGGMTLLSVLNHGFGAWTPAFYERTYGWGPAVAGPLLGMVGLVGSLIGLFLGARVTEWLAKRHDDANLRVMFSAQIVALPLAAMGPLMPSPWLALGCGATAGAFAVMGGPGFGAAIQLATPNEMRGQMAVLYATAMNTIGGSVGPTLVGALTDYVAPSEAHLRYVLVGVKLVIAPLAIYLLWKATAPYGRIYRQRIDAGE